VKEMAKAVVRIGRLYVESVGSDIHMVVLDFDEKSNLVHGVELTLELRQVVELLEALEGHFSKMVEEKNCATCVNYDFECRLDDEQRRTCVRSEKSLYAPKIMLP
jgi:ABC-type phosphate transport system auxiliary subunit